MNQRFFDFAIKLAASAGFVGHIAWAPGTWGSGLGVLIALAAASHLPVLLFILTLLGFAIAPAAVRVYRKNDPQTFVLDEVCGMMLALVGIPLSWGGWALAFVLFRALDIWKPWPIGQVQKSHSPSAIMADDLLAGLSANGLARLALVFFS